MSLNTNPFHCASFHVEIETRIFLVFPRLILPGYLGVIGSFFSNKMPWQVFLSGRSVAPLFASSYFRTSCSPLHHAKV